MCLATWPLGISRGAPSCCGGVLLLPLHPRVALRGLSRVRRVAVFREMSEVILLCIFAPVCVCVCEREMEVSGMDERERK